uniref:Nematode cuticle collagen N-terminal domain-containing protein n=1 Tax=Parascaris equorum TaxID=6256 RepID=A0A914RPP0_PAREQ
MSETKVITIVAAGSSTLATLACLIIVPSLYSTINEVTLSLIHQFISINASLVKWVLRISTTSFTFE